MHVKTYAIASDCRELPYFALALTAWVPVSVFTQCTHAVALPTLLNHNIVTWQYLATGLGVN